ncbi:MAG TPA: class I SAM-dependent methyltransferase [Nitrospirales bacterium]|nr:class I SAM-dependent methyltransferase [Nitrospirales bacterium]
MPKDENTNIERNKEYWDSKESVTLYVKEPHLLIGEAQLLARCFQENAKGMRVLDIGCGAGRTTYFLHQMGMDVVGIDISTTLLDHARKRFPEMDFREGNAEHLEFEDNEFDAVLFIANGLDCLFPKDSRRKCLKEIRRILKPGGLFLSSHHNLSALAFGWYKAMRPWKLWLRITNIANGNFFKPDAYISYPKDSGGLLLYYTWPHVFVRDMKSEGFDLMDITPNSRLLWYCQRALRSSIFTRLADPWPNYAFKKH